MKKTFFTDRYTGAGFLAIGLILLGCNHWSITANGRLLTYAFMLSPALVCAGLGALIDPAIMWVGFVGFMMKSMPKRTRWVAFGTLVTMIVFYLAYFRLYWVVYGLR